MSPVLRRLLLSALLLVPAVAFGQDVEPELLSVADGIETAMSAAEGGEGTSPLQLIIALTTLSFIPAALLAMTPFTRFIIVFALLRQALGLQQSPPNQVLVGLALMLTLLVMRPTLSAVQADAVDPYMAGEITTIEAYDAGIEPMRMFMLHNVDRSDLEASMRIARISRPQTLDDVPTSAIVTAFMLGELRRAFIIGIKVYIPFLVVDIVVASVLLGMGMMMLPPVVISLPFKLLLFVLIDGWNLLVFGLVSGFA